jgi:glycosyltransferase involved in cell wall biosynthesis
MKRLAVVIPCYNYGAFLDEAVKSVLAAGRTDIELVIVDDGSTDPFTRSELDRLAGDGLRVLRQANQGLAATRDAGIRATSAAYLLPLDADNKIRPVFIETALEILDRRPEVGVVYGDAEYFGARTGRWVTGPFQRDRLMRWNYIDACAVLRRSVWEQNGGYDRTMPLQGLEDWDMWMGASSRGWEFSYVPEIFFDYRVKQQSMITETFARSEETADFMARKHARLYRAAWLQLDLDRRSFKTTVRRSWQLGVARIAELCLGRKRV